MKALILTNLVTGERFGVIVSRWAVRAEGGCDVWAVGAPSTTSTMVLETFDEIGNAMDALHVIDEDEAKTRHVLKGRDTPAKRAFAAAVAVDGPFGDHRTVDERMASAFNRSFDDLTPFGRSAGDDIPFRKP